MPPESTCRHQLRASLDRLADELRRSGPQIMPAHLRVLVRRARAMYECGDRELPALARLLDSLAGLAEGEERQGWPDVGPTAVVAAERLKGFARQVGSRDELQRAPAA